jgi:hypothetical protein
LKALPKGRKPSATFWISVGIAPAHYRGEQPHALALLPVRHGRPSSRRTTE